MPHQILVKALLNPSYYITERILIAMTQPEQSRKPRIAHQSTERMNELRAQQKSFALQNSGAKDSATPVCLSKRPVIKVASVGRVPNAADTVEKRGHRQPHGPAAGSARPSAWPTCHVSHPSMTPRSASVLPDAYTSGLSPVMLRMEPYTYPHFSRRRLRGCWLSIYRQRMESFDTIHFSH